MWAVELHTRIIIKFHLHRELPEVGVVMIHVGLDRGTKKFLLVECLEFLPLYFEIVQIERNTLSLQLVAVLSKILWQLELSGMLE